MMSRAVSRRRLLSWALAGAAATTLAACGDEIPVWSDATRPSRPHVFKDRTPFINHGQAGLESRIELMQGALTPNDHFFVRNNSRSVIVDLDRWSLLVEGDAVERPLRLSFADLLRLPQSTLTAYLECAGNHRAMFELLQGRRALGTQWGRGAIGNARWTGVALADVLNAAGVSDDAASVLLVGLDRESPERGFRRVMPIDKAMHPDTMLAHRMNGVPLPVDHGFPLRAIAPGWVGASQIKWLGRIVVSRDLQWTRNNTTSYVLIGDNYTAEGQADGQIVNAQSIKSTLALPWPARLNPGQHRLRGYAHSPHGDIASVEWSADQGHTWRRTQLLGQQIDSGWAQFHLDWQGAAGQHTIMTRATDTTGNTQPNRAPFNHKGYLFNQPLPHPITVG